MTVQRHANLKLAIGNIQMIHLPDNPISQHWVNEVKHTWEDYGYRVNMFEGTVPDTIEDHDLKLRFGIKRGLGRRPGQREFTPTEKAVWHSHARLWGMCAHEGRPMIVVEHDVALIADLPYDFKLSINCFCKTRVEGKSSYSRLPAGAYFITPQGASKLLVRAISRAINVNVDGHIDYWAAENGSDWYGKFICAEQMFDREVGTTIDHGKKPS